MNQSVKRTNFEMQSFAVYLSTQAEDMLAHVEGHRDSGNNDSFDAILSEASDALRSILTTAQNLYEVGGGSN